MKLLTLLVFISFFGIDSKTNEVNGFNDFQNIRWILNEKSNSGIYKDIIELKFITASSQLIEDLPYHLKYGGLTFKKNGVLIEHIWNKCGTGNPPDFRQSHWEITNVENGELLEISNSSLWNGKYLVIKVDSKALKLKRLE